MDLPPKEHPSSSRWAPPAKMGILKYTNPGTVLFHREQVSPMRYTRGQSEGGMWVITKASLLVVKTGQAKCPWKGGCTAVAPAGGSFVPDTDICLCLETPLVTSGRQ